MVPLQISGLVPDSEHVLVIDCMLFAFWCFDCLSLFVTGYYEQGVAEMHPKKIAATYLKTWFPCDALILLSDVAFFILSSKAASEDVIDSSTDSDVPGVLRLSKSMRMLRLLRLSRLLRFRKLAVLVATLFDSLRSEMGLAVVKVAALVVSIVLLNHYIACAWYALAANAAVGEDTWLSTFPNVGKHDLSYLYTMSFHWAVCQFTPATQDIAPSSAIERAFACGVVLLALVTFSSFLGNMTSAMTKLMTLNASRWQDESLLRRFMRDNTVSIGLARRIWYIYRHQTAVKVKKLRMQDIENLFQMPLHLKMRLSAELHTPALQHLPVFAAASTCHAGELPIISHLSISEHLGSPSQEVFHSNTCIDSAFCLLQGSMGYRSARVTAGEVDIKDFDWVCEGALWGTWRTRGTLVSKTVTSRLELNGENFRSAVMQHCSGELLQGLRKYARMLAEAIDFESVPDVIDECERKLREGIATSAFVASASPMGLSRLAALGRQLTSTRESPIT
mmetsp:Transcript_40044/g.121084  ORF Transcript_40044/g.121084 Transcript_40044/m.121084 type:complete len:506 (-) Transcript_40044:34-1551(-)